MAPTSPVTRRALRTLGAAVLLALFTGLGLADTQQFVKVKRVIDGDTIMLQSGERVRLIGVDTPETVHPKKPVEKFGKEASAFTKRTAEGKRVRLEYDQANAVRGHKDSTPQRRTLAYVFLEDGTLLNTEIIRHGYGYALTRFPFSRLEELRRLERDAQEERAPVSRTLAGQPRKLVCQERHSKLLLVDWVSGRSHSLACFLLSMVSARSFRTDRNMRQICNMGHRRRGPYRSSYLHRGSFLPGSCRVVTFALCRVSSARTSRHHRRVARWRGSHPTSLRRPDAHSRTA
jgi:endonuclease YncB( thermonuclease family)